MVSSGGACSNEGMNECTYNKTVKNADKSRLCLAGLSVYFMQERISGVAHPSKVAADAPARERRVILGCVSHRPVSGSRIPHAASAAQVPCEFPEPHNWRALDRNRRFHIFRARHTLIL